MNINRKFNEQELVRREKLKKLIDIGHDPQKNNFKPKNYSQDIIDKYKDITYLHRH